ncbi:MAG: GTPase Era [Deltaproteobacteria bacterium]|nr:GTPase Era [Deltaproteobacteria bacterium]
MPPPRARRRGSAAPKKPGRTYGPPKKGEARKGDPKKGGAKKFLGPKKGPQKRDSRSDEPDRVAPKRRSRPAPRPQLQPITPEDRERKPGEGFVRRAVEPTIGDGSTFRSGYVALVGRPNAGKSTLLNALLGQKLAATTHKPQTTRKNLLGVLHPPGAQLLLLDTPGYHKAQGPLNRFMVAQAETAIGDADVVALVVEAREDSTITPGNDLLVEALAKAKKKVVLLLNKIDLVKKKQSLIHQLGSYRERLGEHLVAAVPISARKRQGLTEAVEEIARALPEGPKYFDDDQLTDASERSVVSEFIREKVMLATRAELPYAVAVSIDAFTDQRPQLVRLMATLHVERESQKGIVIGKGGETLKRIGFSARKDIEFFLGTKVFLELHVRVTSAWSTSRRALAELGYGADEGGELRLEEE